MPPGRRSNSITVKPDLQTGAYLYIPDPLRENTLGQEGLLAVTVTTSNPIWYCL
ncbi:unnamed protein product [Ixodes persulcatus]